jgi:hypothetical protein
MTVNVRVLALVLAAAILQACAEEVAEPMAPSDRFYFPISLATTRLADDSTALLVASSNFDLRYSAASGGTLLSVDPTEVGGAVVSHGDVARIGSYAGGIAVADAETCAVDTSAVLVASRYDDVVRRYTLDRTTGALTCGAGCERSAPVGFDDPFGITVACPGSSRLAYVAYLDPPASAAAGTRGGAWISEIDLAPGGGTREIDLGEGPVRSMAYDAAHDRLWVATRSEGTKALLHSVILSDPRFAATAPSPSEAVHTVDLAQWIEGAELRSIAVASGGTRLFLTARLYSVVAQATLGYRPIGDIDGVLIVLDVQEGGVGGAPIVTLSPGDIHSIGPGVGDVAVVRRASGGDLAVATSSTDGALFVYDDATGALLKPYGRGADGAPVLGDRPLAVAVDQTLSPLSATADVYVASFGDHLVDHFQISTSAPAATPTLTRIGGLAP